MQLVPIFKLSHKRQKLTVHWAEMVTVIELCQEVHPKGKVKNKLRIVGRYPLRDHL